MALADLSLFFAFSRFSGLSIRDKAIAAVSFARTSESFLTFSVIRVIRLRLIKVIRVIRVIRDIRAIGVITFTLATPSINKLLR